MEKPNEEYLRDLYSKMRKQHFNSMSLKPVYPDREGNRSSFHPYPPSVISKTTCTIPQVPSPRRVGEVFPIHHQEDKFTGSHISCPSIYTANIPSISCPQPGYNAVMHGTLYGPTIVSSRVQSKDQFTETTASQIRPSITHRSDPSRFNPEITRIGLYDGLQPSILHTLDFSKIPEYEQLSFGIMDEDSISISQLQWIVY